MVFWPAVPSVVKSRLLTSPDITANLSVSLFVSQFVPHLWWLCDLVHACLQLLWLLSGLSHHRTVLSGTSFQLSIVNVPAVRWSPLLLSQPEDKDTPGTGERPGSLCGFYRLLGKLGTLHIQSGMRALLEIVRSKLGLPDGSARNNALNRRTLTVNKQKLKPSMPHEPHFYLAGQPPLP